VKLGRIACSTARPDRPTPLFQRIPPVNQQLQQDWRAAGEQGFAFEILDTLTPKDTPGYYEAAVVPPAARALLSHFDSRSAHYETVERR
jgi:hypothetical protein